MTAPSTADQQTEPLKCTGCGTAITRDYWLCDIDDGQWCEPCFDKTPCGKKAHGEGCPTQVFATADPAMTALFSPQEELRLGILAGGHHDRTVEVDAARWAVAELRRMRELIRGEPLRVVLKVHPENAEHAAFLQRLADDKTSMAKDAPRMIAAILTTEAEHLRKAARALNAGTQ